MAECFWCNSPLMDTLVEGYTDCLFVKTFVSERTQMQNGYCMSNRFTCFPFFLGKALFVNIIKNCATFQYSPNTFYVPLQTMSWATSGALAAIWRSLLWDNFHNGRFKSPVARWHSQLARNLFVSCFLQRSACKSEYWEDHLSIL